MAKTARQFVFDGMELVPPALTPFVEQRLSSALTGHWQVTVSERYKGLKIENGKVNWDQQSLLQVMNMYWMEAFKDVLGRSERAWVNELTEIRNRLSHNERFSYPDAERALDTMARLLEAVSASEPAQQLDNMRTQILRVRFEEQRRGEERKGQRADITVETVAGLKPWREVIEPHSDVASGDFNQAEFAADLSKVHAGTAASEYSDPKEFYSRTYLTEGLSDLLKRSAERLAGTGGDPVVELQTNFGGGKTHSLLALYHMVGGTKFQDLAGLDQLMSGISIDGPVHRAVLVGTSRGPMDTVDNKDGLNIQTTWGDMAYQLGGVDGYDMVRTQDETGIAPGSETLGELFARFSPCLILIDEWVAYLRQIYKTEGLKSGSFDANLSFVQALTEAVKDTPQTLLVASLPASQIEVGGEGGQEALDRLKQTFSRVHSSWLPASQEESYEIVRRRLFNDILGEKAHHRDNAVKQFMKMYKEDADNFPQKTDSDEYKRKLEKSYPIHPELFDQLYETWSSIDKFQRTRGILRLMAQVVHELWIGNDPSVLIMPCSVPISSQRVEPELSKYLQQGWPAIIAGDVDGAHSVPHQIDAKQPNLGRVSATRRVARTLFLSTAPISASQNTGVDAKRINLGVVQPGEKPVTFSDGLHRLANAATYLHSDTGRYWYTTAPSLNKLASDTAKQFDEELVLDTIDQHLTKYINGIADRGSFDAVHCAPGSSADVPDEAGGVRIVILGVRNTHSSGNASSEAMAEAKNIIGRRGTAPRVYKNVLVFLGADTRALDNLIDAVRSSLAWAQIVRDKDRHNLTQGDLSRAEAKNTEARGIFDTRMQEAWSWIIYPSQVSAHEDISYSTSKLSSQDRLFDRIQKKLESDGALFSTLGPNNLNATLNNYIWNGNPHLRTADLLDYHSRYVYMHRLTDKSVLKETILSAISQMVAGPFAYAEQFDEGKNSYVGLVIEGGMNTPIGLTPDSVIVHPETALNNRQKGEINITSPDDNKQYDERTTSETPAEQSTQLPELPKTFSGSVSISTDRPARDMSRIIEGIIDQLNNIEGAEISMTLEIHADVPTGIDNSKRRTLLENADSLKFNDKNVK
ncbi:DUF499 domain-containing protein [Alphaproteobacteria bacterium]|nr:DUF499 domain-containing protein [Alphaproteobacteria bacterium]